MRQGKKLRLNAGSRKAYIEGMKRYQEQGIRVLIDGKEADDELWEKIFEIREDGGFYMGDYILEEAPAFAGMPDAAIYDTVQSKTAPQTDVLREKPTQYSVRKQLKEIHFDIVYHQ